VAALRELSFGHWVKVMAVTVPPSMRIPEALAVWGPRTFGFNYVQMTASLSRERWTDSRAAVSAVLINR